MLLSSMRWRPSIWQQHIRFRSSVAAAVMITDDVDVDVDRDDDDDDDNVQEQYERKTPVAHVLLRPGMYIGPVESANERRWVRSKTAAGVKQRDVEYIPAFFKIFDEILVNAADNKQRDPSMTTIQVNIEPGSADGVTPPSVSVLNDGKGIPVRKHKTEDVYIPELVFGHLLTGSNFNDKEGWLTGGRHGYGAKLTNIFSTEFKVETADSVSGLRFSQTWRNNMSEAGAPIVESMPPRSRDFTRVSFSPDLARLGYTSKKHIDEHHMQVFEKRVLDIAACNSSLKVVFNGDRVKIGSFRDFMRMHTDTKSDDFRVVDQRVNNRWQVGVALSSGQFEQVSFVNSMHTPRGGTHVNMVANQVVRRLADHINRRHSDLNVSLAQVKSHMRVFVNCLIENPTFDSQMKEHLSSKPATFGSACNLSARFFKQIVAHSGIVEEVVAVAEARQKADLVKRATRRRSKNLAIAKLEDANNAGGPRSEDCCLILTEGDSAKALAVAGLEVVGRDNYGVYPLRGKFLNVRDATLQQVADNAELTDLCAIVGLDFGKTYETPEERAQLRYGSVMLMTDQDHDGSHIKGLIMNVFQHFWPHLLRDDSGFLRQFVTPLMKVSRRREKREFYSVPEFERWRKTLLLEEDAAENGGGKKKNGLASWAVKYYKGLGTSTSAEGREYFENLERHRQSFSVLRKEDSDALDMAFSKARVAERKEWLLTKYRQDEPLDTLDSHVSFADFVDKELIQFSHADNVRSIPSVIDGLKPSQRKVLFGCFKRKLTKEIKVAQLAGYCAEHTAYHHGEASLHATIIGMAQDHVGSNNTPLLEAGGQFGTRLQGGKDHASPRYVFTRLTKIAHLLFPEIDVENLRHREDDGQIVEPEYYVPVVPLLLINGTQGIGTGWSTNIPPHHPLDIIDNIERRLDGEDCLPMEPWVRGFTGEITPAARNKFDTKGTAKRVGATKVVISELPLGRWTQDYKVHLQQMVKQGAIKRFKEQHTTNKVKFVVYASQVGLDDMENGAGGLAAAFKLTTRLNVNNMHAFDHTGNMRKYAAATDILDEFFGVRLELYQQRKAAMEQSLANQLTVLQNRARFISEVARDEVKLMNGDLSRPELVQVLRDRDYQPKPGTDDGGVASYDYLLSMPLYSFTAERVADLKRDAESAEANLAHLRACSATDLWKRDLLELRNAFEKDKLVAR